MSISSKLQEFYGLGCTDQAKCAIACRIYLDLEQDKTISNLTKCYDKDLNQFYFSAVRSDKELIFIPLLNTQDLDLKELEKVQQKIGAKETNSIHLAICDTASNVLYYTMTPGICNL